MPVAAVNAPLLHTVAPLSATIGFVAPKVGTAMVPVVPDGAVTCMLNWPAPLSPDQSTPMLPCGVGTLPSAQARSPGWGCTVQVA